MERKLGTVLTHPDPVPAAEPVATPIVRSTTFAFRDAAELEAYARGDKGLWQYGRSGNPTVVTVERTLARLEGAEEAVLFGSGMAAVSTVALALLEAGDELVASEAIYGGSYRFFRDFLGRWGIGVRFVDEEALARPETYGPRTKLVWLETPLNPTLRIFDLERIGAAARERGVTSIVDATFATPVLLRPLEHGIDLVLHSATKFLNGHSDVLAGVVAGDAGRVSRIRSVRTFLGGVIDPAAAYELGRGLATLEVRVLRQNETARKLAEALHGHPAVAKVHHPGLPGHADHELARRLLPHGTGGMFSISLAGGYEAARRFYDGLRLIHRAASLGGVESLCSLPVLTSHVGYTDEELSRAGVDRGMVRLSIGLEDPADLLADLEGALTYSQANSK